MTLDAARDRQARISLSMYKLECRTFMPVERPGRNGQKGQKTRIFLRIAA